MVTSELALRAHSKTNRDEDCPDASKDVVCKIAGTREEREAAFRLVYQSYLRAGLGEVNRHEMRLTPYHLEPTTEVFVGQLRGTVVATTTLVTDGALGLPMESVYSKEVAERREQGLLIGEVSCLADRRRDFRRFFPLFCRLNQLMVQYARRQGLDQLVVAVHPKHARFYVRYMCFEPIGDITTYPSVQDNPAVALCMDFKRIDKKREEHPERYDKFFGEPISDSELDPRPMPTVDREYFRKRLDRDLQFTLRGQPAVTEPALACVAG